MTPKNTIEHNLNKNKRLFGYSTPLYFNKCIKYWYGHRHLPLAFLSALDHGILTSTLLGNVPECTRNVINKDVNELELMN